MHSTQQQRDRVYSTTPYVLGSGQMEVVWWRYIAHDALHDMRVLEKRLAQAGELFTEHVQMLQDIGRPLTYDEKRMLTQSFDTLLEIQQLLRMHSTKEEDA